MYIVKRGRLSVVADDGVTVLATLGAGQVFGEVSVLDIPGNKTGNRRTANVRSLGYSDLFCLAKRDLWETLGDYPEARASLTERGCQLLRKDGLLDEDLFAKASTVQETLTDGVHKLEKSIDNLNIRLARLLAEYSASQAKLKQRIAKLELRTEVKECVDGNEGKQLQLKAEIDTKRISKPRLENVPTVVFNQSYDSELNNKALSKGLKPVLCKFLTAKQVEECA